MAPCDNTARALLCVLDLGVGTRGPRIARTAMQTRACAATGWGTPCLKIVAPHGLRLPDDAGDVPSPWRSGAALRRCDAASEEERVETWNGGLGTWGRKGLISSMGHYLSVRPQCFVSFCLNVL